MTITTPVINTTIEGFYQIKKYKVGTDELVQDTGEFKNLITDQGLTRWCTGSFAPNCFVGTGSALPSYSDAALNAYLTTNNTIESNIQSNSGLPHATPYSQNSITYRFNAGVATGNLTEVGVGYVSGGNKVCSRALIVDGAGNPITLTVAADEYLDVTYTMRCYIPANAADATYNITVSGTVYAVTARVAYFTSWGVYLQYGINNNNGSFSFNVAYGTGGTLGAVTSSPTASSAIARYSDVSDIATVTGTGVITATRTIVAGLTELNTDGGIKCLVHGTNIIIKAITCPTQFSFSPIIPKDNTKILTLTFSYTITRL